MHQNDFNFDVCVICLESFDEDIAIVYPFYCKHKLHEICFHGKGGYDWNTVYNMPIWLRRFIFNKINEFYSDEKKQLDDAKNGGKQKSLIDSSGNINTPDFAQASQQYKRPAKYK